MRWLVTIGVAAFAVPLLAAGGLFLTDSETGWLGCRIAPPPKALDAQLVLEGKGAMVLNVVKESPADHAGLERYDVIVAFEGKSVESPDTLIQAVRHRQPGDKTQMDVVHQGKRRTADVQLGKQPPRAEQVMKYEPLPDALLDDRIGFRGRVFRKGPEGWQWEDLDELKDLHRLFEDAPPHLRRRLNRYWLGPKDEAVQNFHARVHRNGVTITVEGRRGGPVTVTREDPQGNVNRTKYTNPQDLKAQDAEAYKIYWEATGQTELAPPSPGKRPPRAEKPDAPEGVMERYRRMLDDLGDRLPDIDRQWIEEFYREKSQEWAEGLKDQYDEIRKQLSELQEEVRRQIDELRGPRSEGPASSGPADEQSSTPGVRFEVDADGKITVTVSDESGRVTLEFENEKALEKARPDLHERYRTSSAR